MPSPGRSAAPIAGKPGAPARIVIARGGEADRAAPPAQQVSCGGLAVLEVRDRRALEAALTTLRPAVLFLDLALPGAGGMAGLRRLQRLSAGTRIIVLTRAPDETEAVFALLAGARGYCHRDMSPVLFRKAVDVVQRGEIWIGRRVILRLLERLAALMRERGAGRGEPGALDDLGPREVEIAELIARGASNKEIAAQLRISQATVKAHLTSVFRKLGVPDRLRLALFVTERQPGAGRPPRAART